MALEMQAYWVYGLGHGIIGAYGQWTGRHHGLRHWTGRHHGFIDIGHAAIMGL